MNSNNTYLISPAKRHDILVNTEENERTEKDLYVISLMKIQNTQYNQNQYGEKYKRMKEQRAWVYLIRLLKLRKKSNGITLGLVFLGNSDFCVFFLAVVKGEKKQERVQAKPLRKKKKRLTRKKKLNELSCI